MIINQYFSEDKLILPFIDLSKVEYLWDILMQIPSILELLIKAKTNSNQASEIHTFQIDEDQIYITQKIQLKSYYYSPKNNIYIGEGTILEETAILKNNTFIGENCEVRQGAYIRGNVIVGEHSVIGHTSEIKNTIFLSHSEAGHFAYIGDSIVGSYVNIGAGTKISNLEFRNIEQKKSYEFPTISLKINGEYQNIGISKLGAILGDGCESGCNSVLCPGVVLEKECWIMPNVCVKKGFYAKKSFLK